MIDLCMCYPSRIKESLGKKGVMSPLALPYLARHTPDYYRIQLFDEYVGQDMDPDSVRADLVALSAVTTGISRAYEIGDRLRKRGIPTVIGGSHVSVLVEEALEHFDTVIIGEGERPWEVFLNDFESGKAGETYIGRMDASLEALGTPRRDVIHPNYHFPTVLTSRGCPHSCSFCYLSSFDHRKYRTIPHEFVLEDMTSIKGRFVAVTDENFMGYSQGDLEDRKILLEKLIRKNLKLYWGCQTTVILARDPELLDLMCRAGCRVVFIGFETVNKTGLTEVNKRHNIKIDYREAVKTIHAHNIAVIASFIFGLDSHGKNYHESLIKMIKDIRPDYLRLTYLTAWPGTPLFERLLKEGRVNDDWDNMHVDKPTIRFKNFTHDEALEARKAVLDSFYNFYNILRIALRWIFRYGVAVIGILINMSTRFRAKWEMTLYRGDPDT